MLRYLPRIVLTLLFAAGSYYFFQEFSQLQRPQTELSELSDHSNAGITNLGGKALLNLGGFVVLALGGAICFGMTILPLIGDLVGNAFYNPGGELEKSPHRDALAFIAQGDYEAAIAAYRKVIREHPEDCHAVTEIVRLAMDKLENPEIAVEVLEESLQREWPPDEAASLVRRLADIYWTHLGQPDRARELLGQIVESMPGTRHAANANHQIAEIERGMIS